jgi:TRAP-type C4-dicarboxylate transport system substrate-binding protein
MSIKRGKDMKSNRYTLVLVMIVLILSSPLLFSAGAGETQARQWRFASAEVEGDFMTVWAENFAKEIEEFSNGSIEMEVFPFGTLGAERDIHELAQTNSVQLVFSDYGWIGGFVPQAQVFALPYLWPKDHGLEVFAEVARNGEILKVLEPYFRQKNLEPLGLLIEGWQWITSSRPIRNIDDMRNFKLRVMSSRILIRNYQAYGAAPVALDFGEVYNGLQMKLIDGQVNPMAIAYSMKFFEVQTHMTNPFESLFVAIPAMNLDEYNSLDEATKKKVKDVWKDFLEPSIEWAENLNNEYQKKIAAENPRMTFYEMTEEDTLPFRERAKNTYPEYLAMAGEGGQKVLDTLLQDIENAKKKLGVK